MSTLSRWVGSRLSRPFQLLPRLPYFSSPSPKQEKVSRFLNQMDISDLYFPIANMDQYVFSVERMFRSVLVRNLLNGTAHETKMVIMVMWECREAGSITLFQAVEGGVSSRFMGENSIIFWELPLMLIGSGKTLFRFPNISNWMSGLRKPFSSSYFLSFREEFGSFMLF